MSEFSIIERPHLSETIEAIAVSAVNKSETRKLYKKRQAIYPKLVHGRFRTAKWALLVVTLAVYYLTPWIRWDRGPGSPDQAVLVDFASGRFYFYFIEVWPDEIYYITGLLILAALGLFLFTALLGRVWCGYLCPQTIWTDLYLAVERLIEGDRNQRLRLAASPWSASKLSKRLSKHAIWLVIAAATGGAWVFYFHDAPTLFRQLFAGTAPATSNVFVGLLTLTTYVLAGTMREQVCIYMCPWPRIQAAMMDEESLAVTYRRNRGEPRGAHKKGQSWEGRGHCVDCNQCVAACPMGIDIRDGTQFECIDCALCIDACDAIMRKLGLPTGLIAYDTDKNVSRRAKGEAAKFRFFRPRTILYAVVVSAVGAIMVYALLTRPSIDLQTQRDRNPAFIALSDGRVRNTYTVRVENRSSRARSFALGTESPIGLAWHAVGSDSAETRLDLKPGEERKLRVFLTGPRAITGEIKLTFVARDVMTGEARRNPSVFVAGGSP